MHNWEIANNLKWIIQFNVFTIMDVLIYGSTVTQSKYIPVIRYTLYFKSVSQEVMLL